MNEFKLHQAFYFKNYKGKTKIYGITINEPTQKARCFMISNALPVFVIEEGGIDSKGRIPLNVLNAFDRIIARIVTIQLKHGGYLYYFYLLKWLPVNLIKSHHIIFSGGNNV